MTNGYRRGLDGVDAAKTYWRLGCRSCVIMHGAYEFEDRLSSAAPLCYYYPIIISRTEY